MIVNAQWQIDAGIRAEMIVPRKVKLGAKIPGREPGLSGALTQNGVLSHRIIAGIGLQGESGCFVEQNIGARPAGNHDLISELVGVTFSAQIILPLTAEEPAIPAKGDRRAKNAVDRA